MVSHTTESIARLVGGRLVGPSDLSVEGVQQIETATAGQLTFITSQKYVKLWSKSGASAALVTVGLELEPRNGRALIFVQDADLAMGLVLEQFAPPLVEPPVGIHPSSVVDPNAVLGHDVRVGPQCSIGPGARIGDCCVLHAGVMVLSGVSIGPETVLWPGVIIRERCSIGARCELHAGVIIGSDGFGYRHVPSEDGPTPIKIPHIGTVRIGNDVEIGAGSCVDRAKFSETIVGDAVKIDNLVQIGHNCCIGRGVIIAGCTGIAGSVQIGQAAVLGGMVAVKDHIRIGAGAHLAGCSQLMNDVPDGETWIGAPALPRKEAVKRNQGLKKLPELLKHSRRG